MPRCPASYREAVRRRAYPRPPRNRHSHAIKRSPELVQTPRQPQAISLAPPSSPIGRELAFFNLSGQFGHRRLPAPFGATRASPSPFSSPVTSSFPCEPNPQLNFDREPSPPTNHFVTGASLRRGACRRRFPPPPTTPRPPGEPPQPCGSIPTLWSPRGAAKRRRRSPEPRSARAKEGDDARRLVKPDQWARQAHCQ